VNLIELSPTAIKQCKEFAALRCSDSAIYHKRGSFKYEDVLAGAFGEAAAYKFLRSQDIAVSKPDFTMLLPSQKSFKADLTDGTSHYHVKAQTDESVAKYGMSWLLQRKDPLLNKQLVNHFMILTTVNTQSGVVLIHGIVDVNAIIDNGLIGECKLLWFRESKVAIYASDLTKKLTKEELYCIV
jgi:hypothetical protein